MDYRNSDEYKIDDLDKFVWKAWMKEPKFKEWFNNLVNCRQHKSNVVLTKTDKGYKWLIRK